MFLKGVLFFVTNAFFSTTTINLVQDLVNESATLGVKYRKECKLCSKTAQNSKEHVPTESQNCFCVLCMKINQDYRLSVYYV